MLIEYVEAVLHELVVVGFLSCGAREFGDAAGFGKLNPDLGNEHSLKV